MYGPSNTRSRATLPGLAVALAAAAVLAFTAPAGASASGPASLNNFRASTTPVSWGSTLPVTASVSGATRCTFSIAPSTPAYPKTVSCSSGVLSTSIPSPANPTTHRVTYVLSLRASGPGGLSARRSISLRIPPERETIGSTTIGPGCHEAGARLSGMNLSGLDLTGCDFRGATLSGSNLTSANLSAALLSGAHVASVQLAGALLSGIRADGLIGVPSTLPRDWSLEGGYLLGPGANLRNVSLVGISLAGVDLQHANLAGASLKGDVATRSVLNGADLDGSDLSGTDLVGSVMSNALLDGANLAGADLNRRDDGRLRLDQCVTCRQLLDRRQPPGRPAHPPRRLPASLRAGSSRLRVAPEGLELRGRLSRGSGGESRGCDSPRRHSLRAWTSRG